VVQQIDWRKDKTTPPYSNDDVTRIMAEEGVGRRRAYEIARQRRAAAVDVSSVGPGQRVAVMSCLVAEPDAGKDAAILLDALHRAGVKIDMHDTIKTLWSLQKTRYVSFRERGGRSLYAITVTDAGRDWLRSATTTPMVEAVEEVAHAPQEEIEGTVDISGPSVPVVEVDEPVIEPPVDGDLPWGPGIARWPAIRAVRDRAVRATKINQAVKLLEEAGEEDIALTLMGKTEFTELEEEVVSLLRIMGEIE
jgi:hypothetical protein